VPPTARTQIPLSPRRLYTSSCGDLRQYPGLRLSWLANGVVQIALSAPPVNVLNASLLESLRRSISYVSYGDETYDAANYDPYASSAHDIRHARVAKNGLVLSSDLAHVFSAGLDLGSLSDATARAASASEDKANRRNFDALLGGLLDAAASLYACPVPVIACISGSAPAGGTVLALTADYRIGAALPDTLRKTENRAIRRLEAVMGLNEVAVGIPVPNFVVPLARGALRQPWLADHYLTCGKITSSAKEALDVGFLNELVLIAEDDLEVVTEVAAGKKRGLKIQHRLEDTALAKLESLYSSSKATGPRVIAREHTKLLLRRDALKIMRDRQYLDELWGQLRGTEFQSTIKAVRDQLAQKKKKQ
jgi:enoyl-CoA hydratase/carnithine racemase